jgi:hypothetical protein
MNELLFSDGDLDELILILQMSLYDADTAINQSHDVEEVDALRMHKRTANKWLKRFEQLKKSQAKGGK